MAGDWHGDTAWAIRAVRKMSKLATRPRWLMHGHLHLDYQRRVGLGGGLLEITGLDRDGADHGNWAILEAAGMRWLHFPGQARQQRHPRPDRNVVSPETGGNMDLDRRLDPEIAAALASLPILDLSDIPAARTDQYRATGSGLAGGGGWLALGWLALVLGAVPFLARSEDQDAFLGPGWKSCSSGLD